MAFGFTIKLSDDVESALSRAKSRTLSGGGSFSGNTSRGSFSGKGIVGSYRVISANKVKISITETPYPESLVKETVKKKISEFFR